jgi:protocatechuate 3,4-dioxygenase beta subunit
MRSMLVLSAMLTAVSFTARADDKPADATADDPQAWPIKVLVVDEATDQPISKPQVSLQWGNKTTTHDGDEAGSAIITLPHRTPSYCYLRVRAPGYAPMRAFWSNRDGADPMPETFTFAMGKAIKVGGRVIDEDGDPVADATVNFSAGDIATQTGRRAESSFYAEEYKTDAQGRWECDIAPPRINSGSFRVDHPHFARVGVTMSVDDRIEELRSFTYACTLQRSFSVRGRVTDSSGNPVEGAVLAIGYANFYSDEGPFPLTDADGNYEFTRVGRWPGEGLKPDDNPNMTILAMKVDLAPVMQQIGGWEADKRRAERYMKRTIDFVLPPGRLVRIQAVDSTGKGIPGVRVRPEEWNRTRPFLALVKFGLPQRTDEKGTWEWSWHPRMTSLCTSRMETATRTFAISRLLPLKR